MSQKLSNAYLLLTSAGRIVINTGMGFVASVHRKLFDAVCPGPTPWIILTQGHVDHVGGVSLFREHGSRVVAQRNNGVCQRDDERIRAVRQTQSATWFGAAVAAGTGGAGTRAAFRQDVPLPDAVFDDSYRIDCGGLAVELLATPGGN